MIDQTAMTFKVRMIGFGQEEVCASCSANLPLHYIKRKAKMSRMEEAGSG